MWNFLSSTSSRSLRLLQETGQDSSTVALGIILGLLGSVCINTGNNLQSLGLHKLAKADAIRRAQFEKKSQTIQEDVEMDIEDVDNDGKYKPLPNSSSPIWIFGTVVFVSGSLLNFASYGFAPQSMLASLESIQFVTNILFGKFLLKAEVTKKMYLGTILTVAGTVVAVIFSSSKSNKPSLDDLYHNWFAAPFVSYLIAMGIAIGGINTFYKAIEVAEKKEKPMPYSRVVKPILYATWSALFGTLSVVNAKVLAELLRIQAEGTNIFVTWFFYGTLGMWFFTVGIWLYRLNDALSKFDPLFIIPLLQCNFILFAIISGGIFFKEFEGFSGGQWTGFCCGVCVMFIGLGFLTPSPEDDEDDEDEEEEELKSTAEKIEPNSSPRRKSTSQRTSRRSSRRKSHMGGAPIFDEIEVANDLPSFRQPAPSLMGVGNIGEEWFGKDSVVAPVTTGVEKGVGLISEGVQTGFNAVTGVVATGLVTGAIAAEEIIKGIGDIPEKLGGAAGGERTNLNSTNSNASDSKIHADGREEGRALDTRDFNSNPI